MSLTIRDIKRVFKGHGKAAKKKKNLVTTLTLIGIILLLGFIFFYYKSKNTQVVSNDSSTFIEEETDISSTITQRIGYRKENPNKWLYDSSNLDYSDVFNALVLDDGSAYTQLSSRKEKSAWMEDYLKYFGWSDVENENERTSSGEPEMVSLSTAKDIGKYCGLSEEETIQLLSDL